MPYEPGSPRRGFTLIELLVVIAIIAILAAILFPVFAQAREAARKASCLSQQNQMGKAIMMYTQDFDEVYPQAYYYVDNNSGANGYVQWSGLVQPYMKNATAFVCPSDPLRGHVPTNPFDIQVPRISYVANSAVLPRKRRTADLANVVNLAMLDAPAETIMIAEATNFTNCMNDTSNASGTNNKSHRSMNAVQNPGGGVFNGEQASDYGHALEAVPVAKARLDLAACPTATAAGRSHIVYSQADRHQGGANYVYCDGHSKYAKLEQTLDPLRFQWGKRMYSAGNAQINQPGTTVPVQ